MTTVDAQFCPNCGAPLQLDGNRCAFCRTPLVVTATGTPAVAATPTPAPTPSSDPNAPFAMQVDDVFSIKGRGTVVTGTIASGSVRTGDELVVVGSAGQRATRCDGIEMFRKVLDHASAGDTVGLRLKGLGKDDVGAGDHIRATGR